MFAGINEACQDRFLFEIIRSTERKHGPPLVCKKQAMMKRKVNFGDWMCHWPADHIADNVHLDYVHWTGGAKRQNWQKNFLLSFGLHWMTGWMTEWLNEWMNEWRKGGSKKRGREEGGEQCFKLLLMMVGVVRYHDGPVKGTADVGPSAIGRLAIGRLSADLIVAQPHLHVQWPRCRIIGRPPA